MFLITLNIAIPIVLKGGESMYVKKLEFNVLTKYDYFNYSSLYNATTANL